MQARKGNNYFTELAERAEYGNYARVVIELIIVVILIMMIIIVTGNDG